MKRLIIFLITLINCSKSDDSSYSLNSSIPGINFYVAGYINDQMGNSVACYWHNGKRYDLGKGELTDITVNEGKVYACGFNGFGATYWVDGNPHDLEGDDPEAYSIDIRNGEIYVSGRDNGACYWKNGSKIKSA